MIKFWMTTFWFLWNIKHHNHATFMNQKVVLQNFIIEPTGDKYFNYPFQYKGESYWIPKSCNLHQSHGSWKPSLSLLTKFLPKRDWNLRSKNHMDLQTSQFRLFHDSRVIVLFYVRLFTKYYMCFSFPINLKWDHEKGLIRKPMKIIGLLFVQFTHDFAHYLY